MSKGDKRFAEIRREETYGIEQGIRQWWESQDIFAKSIKLREGAPTYTFYEGPADGKWTSRNSSCDGSYHQGCVLPLSYHEGMSG